MFKAFGAALAVALSCAPAEATSYFGSGIITYSLVDTLYNGKHVVLQDSYIGEEISLVVNILPQFYGGYGDARIYVKNSPPLISSYDDQKWNDVDYGILFSSVGGVVDIEQDFFPGDIYRSLYFSQNSGSYSYEQYNTTDFYNQERNYVKLDFEINSILVTDAPEVPTSALLLLGATALIAWQHRPREIA